MCSVRENEQKARNEEKVILIFNYIENIVWYKCQASEILQYILLTMECFMILNREFSHCNLYGIKVSY